MSSITSESQELRRDNITMLTIYGVTLTTAPTSEAPVGYLELVTTIGGQEHPPAMWS